MNLFEKPVAAIRDLIRIAERSKTSYGCPGPSRAGLGLLRYLAGSQISSGRTGGREAVASESVPKSPRRPRDRHFIQRYLMSTTELWASLKTSSSTSCRER